MPDLLAICMIVRDEEETLPRCLESLAGLDARIYITDTGSRDHTREIARDYGAQIRNFPWINDFSAARNAAISGVAEDWIMNLDADDYFPGERAVEIPRYLKGTANVAFSLAYEVEESSTPSRALKLFRNHLGIRFEGIIHEYFRNSLSRFSPDAIGDIPVLLKHSGYSAGQIERKALRNLPMLQREWERCCAASDWPQMLYVGKKLAENHFLRGESADGVKMLRGLLDLMTDRGEHHETDWKVTLLTHLVSHYHDQHRNEDAELCCREYESVFGHHPLFWLYRGISLIRLEQFAEALRYFDKFEAAAAASRLEGLAIPRALLGPELWNYQGICHVALGNWHAAKFAFEKCVQADPRNPEYQTRLRLSSLHDKNGPSLVNQTLTES